MLVPTAVVVESESLASVEPSPRQSLEPSPRQSAVEERDIVIAAVRAEASTSPATSPSKMKDESSSPSSRVVFRELILNLMMSIHLPNLLQGTSVGIRATLIPIFCSQLGASDALIGVVTAVPGLARIVVGFPAGVACSKRGFVFVMTLSMIVNAVGAVICAAAWTPMLLGTAQYAFGLGIGGYNTARLVLAANIIDKSRRGRLMSIIGGGERWASVIGPLFAGVVIDTLGPRVCSLTIIPIVLSAIACFASSSRVRMLDEKFVAENRLRDLDSSAAQNSASLAAVLRNHGKLLAILGSYSMNVIQLRSCRKLMLPLAGLKAGLSATTVGMLLAVSFAVDASLFFLGGLVMDKFGRKFSTVPTTLNLGIGFYLLSLSGSTAWLFFVAVVFGFADSLGAGMLMTMCADNAPKECAAEFVGSLRTVQDVGQLLGPLIAGWLSHRFSFSVACQFLAILGVVNAVWALIALPNDNAAAAAAAPLPTRSPTATDEAKHEAVEMTSAVLGTAANGSWKPNVAAPAQIQGQ